MPTDNIWIEPCINRQHIFQQAGNEVRLLISGRRMTLALSSAAAPFCSVQSPRIRTLHWADP